MGPFHTTVPAPRTALQNSCTVSGPMSSPSMSSGMASVGTTRLSASAANSVAATVSVGSSSFTPFSCALAIIWRA